MAVPPELSKLVAVAWLGWHRRAPWLRAGLIVLVGVLMGLNAMAATAFCPRPTSPRKLAGHLAVAGCPAEVVARITMQSGVVADLDRRVAQIDGLFGVQFLAPVLPHLRMLPRWRHRW